ncbi:Gfo/Idh/MocA family protein [Verrucomicrobiota bacterium]
MKEVRVGVIGTGGMGSHHARSILDNQVGRCRLTAVCDVDPSRLRSFEGRVPGFRDSRKLIRSGEVDAVLIATPHYGHTTIGIDALKQGLHVLVEKPISVHKADCERLIAAHRGKKQVFAAMFNQRTNPQYGKVRELVARGDLGDLIRVTWIITNWFRTEHYYASGTWRATWAGEGGGVLLNQCPHQLDLLQWICGMPSKIRGFCGLGKRHRIEVEDEVTAYMEFPNGATGVFVTSTGEAPGTDRLELAGEMGRLVVEGGKVAFTRNEVPCAEFSRKTKASFASPPVWNIDIPVSSGGQHREILQNFVDAILDGTALIAPAAEGVRSVEIGNAMLYSALTGRTVDLPLDGRAFERMLKKLVRESGVVKKRSAGRGEDITASFRKP